MIKTMIASVLVFLVCYFGLTKMLDQKAAILVLDQKVATLVLVIVFLVSGCIISLIVFILNARKIFDEFDRC